MVDAGTRTFNRHLLQGILIMGQFGSSCSKKHGKGGLTALTDTKGTPGAYAALYQNAPEVALTQPPWRESRWPKTAQPPIQLDPRAKGVFFQKTSRALLSAAWQL